MQRCALDGGNCILWRCGQNSSLRLQAFVGERAQSDAAELHLRVPSAVGAIRFDESHQILISDYPNDLVSFFFFFAGFLQLIGCLGALRLSEKLLNAYWLLLLVLLIGDAMLGIFWMFKFDRVMHDLQPMLK